MTEEGGCPGDEVGKVGRGQVVQCLRYYGKKFRFYFKLNGISLGGFKIHSRNIVKTHLMVTIIITAGSDLRVDYIASLIRSSTHSFINLSAQ